jgi:two-component system chemotaxis response regulator CheB
LSPLCHGRSLPPGPESREASSGVAALLLRPLFVDRVVVIGGSAGSVYALKEIVARLPGDFPAAVLVVIHISPGARSLLPEILEAAGRLPASHAADGEPLRPGRIAVAPPDHHLLVRGGRLRVIRGPQENRSRPAIDPLFRSAAQEFGPAVIGVILSGLLDDGTAGLVAVKVAGGTALVQDPNDALHSAMPRNATRYVQADAVLPAAGIGERLAILVRETVPDNRRPAAGARKSSAEKDREREAEIRVAEFDMDQIESQDHPGTPSTLACPDCHGTLWELGENDLLRFRCRVGHAFSSESMVAAHDESVERALWAALRALEERAALARRVAAGAERRRLTGVKGFYQERVAEAERDAAAIRTILKQGVPGPDTVADDGR